jgi:hypothetical protein
MRCTAPHNRQHTATFVLAFSCPGSAVCMKALGSLPQGSRIEPQPASQPACQCSAGSRGCCDVIVEQVCPCLPSGAAWHTARAQSGQRHRTAASQLKTPKVPSRSSSCHHRLRQPAGTVEHTGYCHSQRSSTSSGHSHLSGTARSAYCITCRPTAAVLPKLFWLSYATSVIGKEPTAR